MEMSGDKTVTRFEGTQLIVETGSEREVYDAKFLVAALLVSIANSDGEISAIETQKMLQLVGGHFELKSSESLELLTGAMEDLAENPDLTEILKELATILTSVDKEDVAVDVQGCRCRRQGGYGGNGNPVRCRGDDRYVAGISAKSTPTLFLRQARLRSKNSGASVY
jgi:tellurite resistance protein